MKEMVLTLIVLGMVTVGCNSMKLPGSSSRSGVTAAKIGSCTCCKNLAAKLKAAEKGRNHYFARRPYFEALKVMGEGGPYISMGVGRTCTAKDRAHPEYAALKERLMNEVEAKIVEVEESAGLTLQRETPLWENDKGVWCCNWTNEEGETVQK